MSREQFDSMLDYYQREMIYLQNAGGRFAETYPHIAEGLSLGAHGSSDPHVERLLESFAFLTARLQKEVDNKFVRFANTLLDVIYPQFTRPFPSCTIVQFKPDKNASKSTVGFQVSKGTKLYQNASSGHTCHFQTAYPVELWPLSVINAEILPIDEVDIESSSSGASYVLRLMIERQDGPLSELPLKKLRFFLGGDNITSNFLYDALLSRDDNRIFLKGDKSDDLTLIPNAKLETVGFEAEDYLVPFPNQLHDGYRLLQEYSLFPDKFKFIDLVGIDTQGSTRHLDIFIPLSSHLNNSKFKITANNFVLGCTPAANIFRKITEPIDMNQRSVSYPLVPDKREEQFTEIHSVLSVTSTQAGSRYPKEYYPYFSFNHSGEQDLFWSSHRLPTKVSNAKGTDLYLTFQNFAFDPEIPANETVFANVLCINRNLPEFMDAGSPLIIDGEVPSTEVRCLMRPTAAVAPITDGETLWRIISQLSLNHLSISNQQYGVENLREILRLYARSPQSTMAKDINDITDLKTRMVTRRKMGEAWRGFVEGISISITSSDAPCQGTGTLLLGEVLSRFLELYVSMNSFAELTLNSQKQPESWKKWPARIGKQPLA